MKYIFLLTLLLSFTLDLSAQYVKKENRNKEEYTTEETEQSLKHCVTIGLLQGGGSLVGADFETLLTKKFGIQIGAGFVGYGAALNYHFKPSIRSSFLSFAYWHQGIGESFTQSILGGTYVYRSKKWFTFQAGLGIPLAEGPGLANTDFEQPPVMLMYSIGAYIPW